MSRIVTLTFAALLVLTSGQPLRAAPTTSTSDLVQSTSDRILSEIKTRRAEFEADDAALQAFVHGEMDKVLDQTYTARLVLGLHARTASAQQITEFAKALSDNLTRRYAHALLEVDGKTKIHVLGETALRGGKIIRTKTEVLRSAGAPVAVDYLFREVDGEWRAFDVIVEGISYVQTFRNQFDPLVREKGLERVTADLREGRIDVETETNDSH